MPSPLVYAILETTPRALCYFNKYSANWATPQTIFFLHSFDLNQRKKNDNFP